jgi:alpha-D-ribose 1-methylphosphonate 5-triphosphate synthase subunit PhnH
MTTVSELPVGFADKVFSAQSTFRSVMDAMARPGRAQKITSTAGTPAAMMHGTAAIALTLFDHDTPIWLDTSMSQTTDVAQWLKFHSSAPVVQNPAICHFALIGNAAALPALDQFSFGSNEYPDRSTTLIIQVESLTQGLSFELRGPGIDGSAILRATLQPADLFHRLDINAALFPRGIDVVLVHEDEIVAIPRTTRLVAKGE